VKPGILCFLVYELVKIIQIRFIRTRYGQLKNFSVNFLCIVATTLGLVFAEQWGGGGVPGIVKRNG
jgi:hypothetical protein